MRAPLTTIEQDVYQFLLDHLAEHTFQPSVRDIGRHCKIASTKSVTDLLASLETKGYIEREPGRSLLERGNEPRYRLRREPDRRAPVARVDA